jgi:(Z)-2-((N-methylformamido)methylene)-5-hydroxybutyrolactone dehydrogenase
MDVSLDNGSEYGAPRFPLYIGGEYRAAAGGEWFETDDPFVGEPWALVARGAVADVDAAVRAAHAAFVSGPWPKMTAAQRGDLLRKLADAVDDNAETLARAELKDNGKTITEMRGQMKSLAAVLRFFAGAADKILGEVLPADEHDFLTYTRYEPLGVIAAICPWNSPVRLFAMKFAPAVAAGNTVVCKPSEYTSTSIYEFVRLVEKVGFPKGVLNVVTGMGAEIGAALAEHPLVKKVSFTGGVPGGTAAYLAAAKGLKPVVLELGGKSPNIVFADADLAAAAEGVAAGVFGSTGQTCVAGSRLLVHESVREAFLEKVAASAKRCKIGNPLDEKTEIGPVANRPQFERILKFIETGKTEGATLYYGGRELRDPSLGKGLFIEPTIFTDVRPEMTIAQEEAFGPILSVISFRTDEEAVNIANDVRFGLAAGIWTRDLKRAHTVAKSIQAGTVWINTYRKNAPQVPVGGYKQSGLGRESGMQAIRDFTQVKSVWVNLA